MIALPFLSALIFAASIWVAVDAASVRRERNLPHGPGNAGPIYWWAAFALVWPIVLPLYLVRRGEAMRVTRLTDAEREALRAAPSGVRSFVHVVVVVALVVGLSAGAFAVYSVIAFRAEVRETRERHAISANEAARATLTVAQEIRAKEAAQLAAEVERRRAEEEALQADMLAAQQREQEQAAENQRMAVERAERRLQEEAEAARRDAAEKVAFQQRAAQVRLWHARIYSPAILEVRGAVVRFNEALNAGAPPSTLAPFCQQLDSAAARASIAASGDLELDRLIVDMLGSYRDTASICRDSQIGYLRRDLTAAAASGGRAYRAFAQRLGVYGLAP